jgi:hypothetical protein
MTRFYGGGRGCGKTFASQNKYGAQKCQVNGEVFDSRKEAMRWQELRILEQAGHIANLRRQVKYVLIPAQKETTVEVRKKGAKRVERVVERECAYVADFVYEEDGETVVEDAKGVRTEAYKIKKKLMLYVHGIKIREV